MSRWIILDRDGVINHDSPDYIKSPEEWIPIKNSLEAIALLNKKGYSIAIATNQSGLARGYYDLTTLEQIHHKMMAEVTAVGGKIAHIAICPHGPNDSCTCRKPLPGLLLKLAEQCDIDLCQTLFVGDSHRDIETARNAKAIPVLVLTGNGTETLAKYSTQLSDCAVYPSLWDFALQYPTNENVSKEKKA